MCVQARALCACVICMSKPELMLLNSHAVGTVEVRQRRMFHRLSCGYKPYVGKRFPIEETLCGMDGKGY